MNKHPHNAPEIVLIAAVARNGVIGRGGELVFREAADQRHFRAATLGCPVIMGRRTWDSLPQRFRPLPGRRNIVVSRNPGLQAEGAEVAANLQLALGLVAQAPRAFVIGGAQLYAQALPLADRLLLTEIDAVLEGDVHFPTWDHAQFVETGRQSAADGAGLPFHFVEYRRRGDGLPGAMPESNKRTPPEGSWDAYARSPTQGDTR